MKSYIIKYMLLCLVIVPFTVTQAQRLDRDQEFRNAFKEATRNFLFGKYVQAVNLYKECLRINPESGATHYQLSKVYLTAGNVPLAELHARKAVESDSENKWYLQSLGDMYQYEQKFDSAIIMYERLLDIERNNVNIMYGIASLYEKTKKFDRSLEYLDRIDEQIGQSKEVSLARYRVFESLNMPNKAIEELKMAASLSSGEYAISGMIAEFYQRHNMIDSAYAYYNEIFPEYSADANVVFSYANFLLQTGKSDSAKLLLLDVMNDSLTDDIVKSGYFYNVLRDDENFRVALPVIDTVTKAFVYNNEEDIRALSVYADVFLRLRKYHEATWALTKIVDKDPSNYPATEQLIYTLNILGKTDSVLLFSNRAIRMNGEKPLIYLFSGSAYYQKKEYNNAIRDLSRGLLMTEDNALKLEFYGLLAECYQQTQKFEESENAFRSALALDKNNLPLKNNFAYYLSLRKKDLKQALSMSRETIKAEPENSTYLDTYAWILYKQGKTGKAKKYILKAIEHGGADNEEIMAHSAEIHIGLGEYSEAVKYLEKIVTMPDETHASKARERIREINSLMNKR